MKMNTTRWAPVVAALLMLFAVSGVSAETITEIPENAIIVALDGSGHTTSLQEAVNQVRSFSPEPRTIFIKKGVYREKVVIETWHTNITIIGEDADSTILVWDDHNGKVGNGTAYWSDAYSELVDRRSPTRNGTFLSSTLIVYGNDITVENLTVENDSGRKGQAMALHVEGDRVRFDRCRFLGNQDTIYLGRAGSRVFFNDCFVTGTTDFIFGPSTAVFYACEIRCKTNSFITAASTPADVPFGFVLAHCRITADPTCTKMLLGRPWRKDAHTAFLHCEMGDFINPVGWNNWGKKENEQTARYEEFGNTGPGAEASERAPWTRRLTPKQAKRYTIEKVFDGMGGPWIPANVTL